MQYSIALIFPYKLVRHFYYKFYYLSIINFKHNSLKIDNRSMS